MKREYQQLEFSIKYLPKIDVFYVPVKLVTDTIWKEMNTCKKLSWAVKLVDSFRKAFSRFSSSAMYLTFLSFDLAADCLFAQILTRETNWMSIEYYKWITIKNIST